MTVNVYNATDRAGLARTHRRPTLKTRGFGIGSVANDPLGKSVTTSARSATAPTGKDNAQLMRFYVAGATLVLDKRTDATVDLVLGAKFKAVAPQKAVDAALAKPVVVAAAPAARARAPKPTAKPASREVPQPLEGLTPGTSAVQAPSSASTSERRACRARSNERPPSWLRHGDPDEAEVAHDDVGLLQRDGLRGDVLRLGVPLVVELDDLLAELLLERDDAPGLRSCAFCCAAPTFALAAD